VTRAQDFGAEPPSFAAASRASAAATIALKRGSSTQGIEVRIGFGVVQEANGQCFENRTQQFECGV
jgi:hypothetical protein